MTVELSVTYYTLLLLLITSFTPLPTLNKDIMVWAKKKEVFEAKKRYGV
jgi:hypothetical protein